MVLVLVKFNNVDNALKTLKKKMQHEGVFRTLKIKRFYEKPSEKKVRKAKERKRRNKKFRRSI